MTSDGGPAPERTPRRARYIIPQSTPRRAEVVAVLGTLLVLLHLLVAQLTGVFALLGYAITRGGRLHRSWLWVPVGVGLIWTLAIGPANAINDWLAGPRQVLDFLGGIGAHPKRIEHLDGGYAGIGGWLPRQLPVALVVGAAEAAFALMLRRMHTNEWHMPEVRRGLVIRARRLVARRAIGSGRVVSKDGAVLGICETTGRPATLSWVEAAGGVLVTGVTGSGKTTTCRQVVHAAIRRRKPVIAVDLTGSPETVEAMRAMCDSTGTPFQLFTADGSTWYEPLRGVDPDKRAAMLAGMVDWTGTGDQYRRSCTSYLRDLFAVVDAAPGDGRTSTLDEVVHLVDPAALQARAACIPDYQPDRDALIARAGVAADTVRADPQSTAGLIAQLTELHESPIGRRLRPDPYHGDAGPEGASRLSDAEIDLGRVVRSRAAVLFSLPPGTRIAATVAGLVAGDVLELGLELRRIGVDGDGLVWLDGFEDIGAGTAVELAGRGRDAGLPMLLCTASKAAATRLAEVTGTHVVHRVTDRGLAGTFAALTGERVIAGQAGTPAAGTQPTGYLHRQVVSVEDIGAFRNGEFSLVVTAPKRRILERATTIRSGVVSRRHAEAPQPAEPPDDATPPRPGPPTPGEPEPPVDAPRPAVPGVRRQIVALGDTTRTAADAPDLDLHDAPLPPSASRRPGAQSGRRRP